MIFEQLFIIQYFLHNCVDLTRKIFSICLFFVTTILTLFWVSTNSGVIHLVKNSDPKFKWVCQSWNFSLFLTKLACVFPKPLQKLKTWQNSLKFEECTLLSQSLQESFHVRLQVSEILNETMKRLHFHYRHYLNRN